MRVSKCSEVLRRAALTNGSWKMRDEVVFSIVLLSKNFVRWCFFLIGGGGLSILKSVMSNVIKYY